MEQEQVRKCLICGGVTAVDPIQSQLKELLEEVYQTFLKYLAADLRGEYLPDSCGDVFPFCQLCQHVPIQVHRLDQNIQSDSVSIQKLILKVHATIIITSIRRQIDDLGAVSSTNEEKSPVRIRDTVFSYYSPSVLVTRYDSRRTPVEEPLDSADEKAIEMSLEDCPSSYHTEAPESSQYEDQEPETIEVSCPSSEVEFEVDQKSRSSNSMDDLVVEKSRVGVGISTENDQESESPTGTANVEAQRPLTFDQAIVQTGPTTFIYLENYKIEKVGSRFKCCTCGWTFGRKACLFSHVRKKHAKAVHYRRNIVMTEKSPNRWYYGEFMAEKIGDTYQCSTCSFYHSNREKMRNHLRERHYLAKHPEDSQSSQSSNICETCGKSFHLRSALNEHQYVHSEQLSFKCRNCPQAFNTRKKLFNHQRTNHLGEEAKKCVCEYCGKGFWQKEQLAIHLATHTKEYRFLCKDCGKPFASASSLKIHGALHAGERYVCDECGKSFSQTGTLYRHKRVAHSVGVGNYGEEMNEAQELE